MLLGLFLLFILIVKVISQYKYKKFNDKKANTILKYRKLPFGVEDQFSQDSIEDSVDVFSSSFNSDLYLV